MQGIQNEILNPSWFFWSNETKCSKFDSSRILGTYPVVVEPVEPVVVEAVEPVVVGPVVLNS
jgi:hypothetical protein